MGGEVGREAAEQGRLEISDCMTTNISPETLFYYSKFKK